MRFSVLYLLFLVLFFSNFFCAPQGNTTMPEAGHEKENSMKKHMDMDHEKKIPAETDLASKVRVDEKLGEIIDLDTWFFDENGKKVMLSKFFDKPVVILPIYFFCPTVCNFLQADLAHVLNKIDQIPGKDFNVISLSFSDDETHEHAADAKRNYAKLITKDFPIDKWLYLTGTKENIKKLTDSIGFFFIKQEKHLYVHPNVLVVLAKDGKITRYVYGPNFLPFDVGMALAEADKGIAGASIKRGVLSFCFNYDPDKKTYVLSIFRITGTVILLFLIGFVLLLIFLPKKQKTKT
ncbi:MAG: SCO family protein [Desulfobacteraceae bacterium]|nr:SCO family protein [Desulfobacteraceae bacterium]